jgi:hypothetical protein
MIMLTLLLTAEEIIELTECQRSHEQKQWLDARGWVYEVSRLGTVKVLRAYAEMRLGLPAGGSEQATTEPDFSGIGRAT